MSQNAEHIEAKLCAYIDGALEPAELAEIEKHLVANPAHRQVIEELKQMRQMVLDLPRAAAPPDIAETIQGHLERAVLLNNDADEHHSDLRINRRPQMMAIAAILLLATGLSIVVYSMLPRHSPQVVIAPNPKNAAQPNGVSDQTAGQGQQEERQARAAKSAATPQLQNAKPNLEQSVASAGAGAAPDPLNPSALAKREAAAHGLVTALSPKDAQQLRIALDRRRDRAEGPDPLMLVGVTPDVDAVSNKLVSYLNANNIQWDTNPLPEQGAAQADKEQTRSETAERLASDKPSAGGAKQTSASPGTPPGPAPLDRLHIARGAGEPSAAPAGIGGGNAGELSATGINNASAATTADGASTGAGRKLADAPAPIAADAPIPAPGSELAPGAVAPRAPTTGKTAGAFAYGTAAVDEKNKALRERSKSDDATGAAPIDAAEAGDSARHRTVIVARGLSNDQVQRLAQTISAEPDARWSLETSTVVPTERDSASSSVREFLSPRESLDAYPATRPVQMRSTTSPTADRVQLALRAEAPAAPLSSAHAPILLGGDQPAAGQDAKSSDSNLELRQKASKKDEVAAAKGSAQNLAATTNPPASQPADPVLDLKTATPAAPPTAPRYDCIIVLQTTPLATAAPATRPTDAVPPK